MKSYFTFKKIISYKNKNRSDLKIKVLNNCLLKIEKEIKDLNTKTFNKTLHISNKCTEAISNKNDKNHLMMTYGYNGINIRFWNIIKRLGSGDYGEVHLIKESNNQQHLYRAVKLIKKKNQSESKVKEKIFNEYKLARSINSSYVVKTFSMNLWKNSEISQTDFSEYCIIQELVEHGNLIDYYFLCNKIISLKARKMIIFQILLGLEAIHKEDILHRDLKPSNIFMSSNTINNPTIKIGDFGCANKISKNNKKLITGNIDYSAPEALQGKAVKASEVWSVGVILLFLSLGRNPFIFKNIDGSYDKLKTRHNIFNHKLWLKSAEFKNLTDSIKPVIRGIMKQNPENRATINQIKNNIFFANLSSHSSII